MFHPPHLPFSSLDSFSVDLEEISFFSIFLILRFFRLAFETSQHIFTSIFSRALPALAKSVKFGVEVGQLQ